MKKWIAFVSILLALVTILAGCSAPQTPAVESGTANGNTTETVTDAPAPPAEPRTLSINGVDISQYKIIYALNADKQAMLAADRTSLKTYWNDAYDGELQTAKRLAQLLKSYFGVELEMGVDTVTEESEYEILIGETNRAETQTAASTKTLAIDDYEIKPIEKKLVIRGGKNGSMYHGLDALEEMFQNEANGRAYTLIESAPITGSYHLQRIAVIGDSITEGYSASNRQIFSYVPTMARMYWQESVVYNYGKGSMTMRSDHEHSYQACDKWTACLANTEQYDVVLIMLGTNDSNRVWKMNRAWNEQDDAIYKSSARAIIDRVKQHSPNTEFVLMNCPAYYGTKEFGSARVRNLQKEIADTLKAEGYQMHLYDMYTYTTQNLGSSMFPDQLHPNDEGHFNMAKGVASMLRTLAAGKTSQYLLY